MGEAKNRGTFEQRRAEAMAKEASQPVVIGQITINLMSNGDVTVDGKGATNDFIVFRDVMNKAERGIINKLSSEVQTDDAAVKNQQAVNDIEKREFLGPREI